MTELVSEISSRLSNPSRDEEVKDQVRRQLSLLLEEALERGGYEVDPFIAILVAS